ncbi:MAG: hypothetical protein ABIB98_01430 [bacterium]
MIDVLLPKDPTGGNLNSVGKIMGLITNIVFYPAVSLAMIFLIIGGIKLATSGGDKMAIDSAKKTVTYAIVGFVLIVSFRAIMAMIQNALGSDVPLVPDF